MSDNMTAEEVLAVGDRWEQVMAAFDLAGADDVDAAIHAAAIQAAAICLDAQRITAIPSVSDTLIEDGARALYEMADAPRPSWEAAIPAVRVTKRLQAEAVLRAAQVIEPTSITLPVDDLLEIARQTVAACRAQGISTGTMAASVVSAIIGHAITATGRVLGLDIRTPVAE